MAIISQFISTKITKIKARQPIDHG